MTKVAKIETRPESEKLPVRHRARERGQLPVVWDDIDRMFDRFFEGFGRRGWLRPFSFDLPGWADLGERLEGRMPRVDVVDRDQEVLVQRPFVL